ncbi:WYL domain-containing transcriptional regulator [Egibacter rhizosphaerae]|uniref:WYL domain-containing transcriptional regulator n=1 Tax=Egibacter rhizosphaerae TaxID=1670831 RepID=A0A411YKH9_9ACTN|nr:WYL domain-containing protein [Egibacter rhizosphaerae]QBI21719.1 WYL domain-containing transcriptional regulator [Egibacter rhizosphaerae]
MAGRLERLLNLVIALRDARRPLTAEEIRTTVAGYGQEATAFRRMFERDKAELRALGVPIETARADRLGEVEGYRIPTDAYELPPLDLTPEELTALAAAARAVQLDTAGLDAPGGLRRLAATEQGQAIPSAHSGGLALRLTPDGEVLPPLLGALREQRRVRFDYAPPDRRPETRNVEPAGLVHRRGRWYLVAWDRDRGADRAFRVDRIRGGVTFNSEPGAFESRPTVDVTEVVPPAEPVELEVAVAPGVEAEVARAATEPGRTRTDGWTRFRVLHRDSDAAVRWALAHFPEVRVEGPPSVVDRVTAARALLAAEPSDAQAADVDVDGWRSALVEAERVRGEVEEAGTREAAGSDGGVATRIDRLLALVPWVLANPGATLDELANRFGGSPEDIAADLDVLGYCGVPGYGGGDLVETRVVGDRVTIRLADWFRRPLRLDLPQALGLLLAAHAVAAIPGGQPGIAGSEPRAGGQALLEHAASRLAAALGIDEVPVALDVTGDGDEWVADAREAVEGRRVVRLVHRAADAAEPTVREVEPWATIGADGWWYLRGWCRSSQAPRDFRLDRVHRLETTGELAAAPPPDATARPPGYRPAPDHPLVVLRVRSWARWQLEGTGAVEEDGIAALRVRSLDWAARLVLAGEGGLRVIDPPELAARVAALAQDPGGSAGPTRR